MFNRLAVVLLEKKVHRAILAKALGVTLSTVSRWCSNYTQPSMETLYLISKAIGVPIGELQYIVPKTYRVKKEIDLSILGVNDAMLYTVQGQSILQSIQGTYFRINTIYSNGKKESFPLPLISYVSLYQNPKVPLIEVDEVIENCTSSILRIENTSEELTLTFLCQDNTN